MRSGGPLDLDPIRADLTPTQDLALEVLAGRARCGEKVWTFEARHRSTLRQLEAKGLIGWKHGIVEATCLAWLTDAGRAESFGEGYVSPVESLRAQLAAVKQLHQPVDGGILGLRCRWCTDSDGVRFAWPCPTARAPSRGSDERGTT